MPAGSDRSLLDELRPEQRDELVATATERSIAAGAAIFPASVAWTRAGVVREGVARAYLAASDGRQLTVRYVRPGGTIGSPFPVQGARAPLAIEAVTACTIVEFDPAVFLRIMSDDAAAAVLVVETLTRRLEDLYATLAANAFGSMRERVAGNLLDRAVADPASGELVAAMTQQELADGVGTVRETVARVLREFRDEGLIATGHSAIRVLDPVNLAALVGRWRTLGR